MAEMIESFKWLDKFEWTAPIPDMNVRSAALEMYHAGRQTIGRTDGRT
jgi:hypothetical protein